MAYVSCSKLAADKAELQAEIDALEAKVQSATTTSEGIVELATQAEVAAASDLTRAVTAGALAGALNDAAGPNNMQKAVVNAVEIALASDTGAQAAVAAALGFKDCNGTAIAVGTAVATCANVDSKITAAVAAIPGDKYLQGLQSYNPTTNIMTFAMSDGSTVSVDMTGLLNDALASGTTPSGTAGGALTGTYPNPGLDSASVIAAVPDATSTVKGKVSLAVASEAPSASDTEAATPAYVSAAIAAGATPDATSTVKGKVSLAVASEVPSTSDTEATTPAFVNAAIAAAFANPTAAQAQAMAAAIAADSTALATLMTAMSVFGN